VDPRGRPRQIVHGLQKPLRIFHAPANEDVQINVLLLAGEELCGPRIVDLHPAIDRQRRLIGQFEIQPGFVQGPHRPAELGNDHELGLVDEQQAAPGDSQDQEQEQKNDRLLHGISFPLQGRGQRAPHEQELGLNHERECGMGGSSARRAGTNQPRALPSLFYTSFCIFF
jgi:hypothetical protein